MVNDCYSPSIIQRHQRNTWAGSLDLSILLPAALVLFLGLFVLLREFVLLASRAVVVLIAIVVATIRGSGHYRSTIDSTTVITSTPSSTPSSTALQHHITTSFERFFRCLLVLFGLPDVGQTNACLFQRLIAIAAGTACSR